MAIANIKVTLLCPIEKVWDKVIDLSDFYWRRDIKVIDENIFIEIQKMEWKHIMKLQNTLNTNVGLLKLKIKISKGTG